MCVTGKVRTYMKVFPCPCLLCFTPTVLLIFLLCPHGLSLLSSSVILPVVIGTSPAVHPLRGSEAAEEVRRIFGTFINIITADQLESIK